MARVSLLRSSYEFANNVVYSFESDLSVSQWKFGCLKITATLVNSHFANRDSIQVRFFDFLNLRLRAQDEI